MKSWTLPALALAGLLAVALTRAARPEPRGSSPPPAPAAPRAADAALEPAKAPAAAGPPEPRDASAADPEDAEVDALLRDQESLDRLWARLDQLQAVRARLAPGKHERAALRFTAEALRLEPAAFSAAAGPVLAELRGAARRHAEELALISAGAAGSGLGELYEDHRRRARERIASCLDARPLHRLFANRLDEWVTYLQGESP
jgi:hypothetical protein